MAAIAPWFRLRLSSCGPGFESQAHHLCFFQFVLKLYWEKNENKQKEAGIGPFLKGNHNHCITVGVQRNLDYFRILQSRGRLKIKINKRPRLLHSQFIFPSWHRFSDSGGDGLRRRGVGLRLDRLPGRLLLLLLVVDLLQLPLVNVAELVLPFRHFRQNFGATFQRASLPGVRLIWFLRPKND